MANTLKAGSINRHDSVGNVLYSALKKAGQMLLLCRLSQIILEIMAALDSDRQRWYLLLVDLIQFRNMFVYQPKVDSHHHSLVGVDAPVRWDDAEYGPVSPVEFVTWAGSPV